jgi:hypothetical protein
MLQPNKHICAECWKCAVCGAKSECGFWYEIALPTGSFMRNVDLCLKCTEALDKLDKHITDRPEYEITGRLAEVGGY